MIPYQIGDIVVQRMWGRWFRDVLIETQEPINGRSGFTGWIVEETPDGDLLTKSRVWGYSAQIVRNLGSTVRNRDGDRIFATST